MPVQKLISDSFASLDLGFGASLMDAGLQTAIDSVYQNHQHDTAVSRVVVPRRPTEEEVLKRQKPEAIATPEIVVPQQRDVKRIMRVELAFRAASRRDRRLSSHSETSFAGRPASEARKVSAETQTRPSFSSRHSITSTTSCPTLAASRSSSIYSDEELPTPSMAATLLEQGLRRVEAEAEAHSLANAEAAAQQVNEQLGQSLDALARQYDDGAALDTRRSSRVRHGSCSSITPSQSASNRVSSSSAHAVLMGAEDGTRSRRMSGLASIASRMLLTDDAPEALLPPSKPPSAAQPRIRSSAIHHSTGRAEGSDELADQENMALYNHSATDGDTDPDDDQHALAADTYKGGDFWERRQRRMSRHAQLSAMQSAAPNTIADGHVPMRV
ncbi:hypothetical protein PYCC9005_001818 [Savitreella phatthalungensis]